MIFGEAAVNYEEGKWEKGEGDKEAVFRPDYDLIRTPTGDMQAFADSNDRPQYHYGDYISGSAVRHDASAVFKQIRSNVRAQSRSPEPILTVNQVARNAIALDMEASAFLKLCSYAGVSSLGVVKGISDFGDSAKGKEPDAYDGALRNTAVGLREWVIHTIPAVNWQLNEGKGLQEAIQLLELTIKQMIRRVSRYQWAIMIILLGSCLMHTLRERQQRRRSLPLRL